MILKHLEYYKIEDIKSEKVQDEIKHLEFKIHECFKYGETIGKIKLFKLLNKEMCLFKKMEDNIKYKYEYKIYIMRMYYILKHYKVDKIMIFKWIDLERIVIEDLLEKGVVI